MATEQITIFDVFTIIPDFIDAKHPEYYLCEKIVSDSGGVSFTVKDNKTFELLFESLET
jgi:hypothetical protein